MIKAQFDGFTLLHYHSMTVNIRVKYITRPPNGHKYIQNSIHILTLQKTRFSNYRVINKRYLNRVTNETRHEHDIGSKTIRNPYVCVCLCLCVCVL